jgi:hypothetical protein
LFNLEAISANNGWAISVIGITIVFSGLTLLSLIISQLHRALDLWDKKGDWLKAARVKDKTASEQPGPEESEKKISRDLPVEFRQYRLLVEWLGEPFALPELVEVAEKRGLKRVHSTVNDLLLSGYIVADGKGYYNWKSS